MKLALVVQRYGSAIAGGSEAHCRELAERLCADHDVTVLTSCAADYVTWDNVFPPGPAFERGVHLIRFAVAHPRRLTRFADLSDEVFAGGASADRQRAWFRENGPDVPGLLAHLRDHGRSYDLVLFWTFRYFPSFFGLPLVADRAVLLPTAEEDQAIDLPILADYFRSAAGYLFLTPEEQRMVSLRAGTRLEPAAIIGMGIDRVVHGLHAAGNELSRRSGSAAKADVLTPLALPERFVLYLGRVDRNKGCDTLLEYFQDYLRSGAEATLVLAGPAKLRIPAHPRIRALGYVSNDVREALLARAQVLIIPSPYESLSIVLLEGWNHGVPALVNAGCRVLEGQVRRADGGLHYRSSREFVEALAHLLRHPDLRAALGRQGRDYVDREYRWPTVLARVTGLLAAVRSRQTDYTGMEA